MLRPSRAILILTKRSRPTCRPVRWVPWQHSWCPSPGSWSTSPSVSGPSGWCPRTPGMRCPTEMRIGCVRKPRNYVPAANFETNKEMFRSNILDGNVVTNLICTAAMHLSHIFLVSWLNGGLLYAKYISCRPMTIRFRIHRIQKQSMWLW